MKDDFNLEQILGKMAQSIANKKWRDDFKTPLGKLLDMASNKQAAQAFTDTVDFLSERLGKQQALFLTDELLGQKHEDTADFRLLQKWLLKKWEAAGAELLAENADAAMNYAQIAARHKKPDHPLAQTVVKYWAQLADRQEMKDDFTIRYYLNPESIENAHFRAEVLTRLSYYSDTQPKMVLETLNKLIDQSNFHSFKETDTTSVKVMAQAMGYILENNSDKLESAQRQDIAWKLMVHLKGAGDTTAVIGAKHYLAEAQAEKDVERSYRMLSGVIERTDTPALAAYGAAAKDTLLTRADAGAYAKEHGFNDVVRIIEEKIFIPAKSDDKKDDALAERAANTLLAMAKTGLQDGKGEYQYLNVTASLYEFFPAGDLRGVEAVELWKAASKQGHKGRETDPYYMRSMGWLFESASKKGDTDNAAYALAEWKEKLESLTAKAAGYGYQAVQEVLNREAQTPGSVNTVLLDEAKSRLPALEKAAGVVFLPDTINLADYGKVLQTAKDEARAAAEARKRAAKPAN